MSDVKMGKTGGGGLDVRERQERVVKNVGFPAVFLQNSYFFPTLYGLALRWWNFWSLLRSLEF
jgi:hypothetical protein